MGLIHKIRTTLEMIKWEHSIFALPFALTAALLAARGVPGWRTLGLILVAMVTARSCAMAFNRWADAELDAANPRTSNRAIPAGLLSRQFVLGFTICMALAFIAASAELNRLTLYLSPAGADCAAWIQLYEARHALVTPRAWPGPRSCPGCRMDRGSWQPRSTHPCTYRRGHALGRRF